MIFKQFFDETSCTYSYILGSDTAEPKAIIIDPVKDRIEEYLTFIKEFNLTLVYAIDTHIHADHITALGELRNVTQCITIMGNYSAAKCVSRYVENEELITIDNITLKALYTPGHTNESFSFLLESSTPKLVFTGDVLLINSTGRTDFQGGDAHKSWSSIMHILFTLPEDTIVYPGHDYKGAMSSTIGEEKHHNPRLAQKTEDEYVDLMNNLHLPNPKMMDVAIPSNMSCGQLAKPSDA